jgi:hypothetical protein
MGNIKTMEWFHQFLNRGAVSPNFNHGAVTQIDSINSILNVNSKKQQRFL